MVKNPPANAGDTGSIPGPEDSTCHRATKPVCTTTTEPPHALNTEAHEPRACALQQEKPPQ